MPHVVFKAYKLWDDGEGFYLDPITSLMTAHGLEDFLSPESFYSHDTAMLYVNQVLIVSMKEYPTKYWDAYLFNKNGIAKFRLEDGEHLKLSLWKKS